MKFGGTSVGTESAMRQAAQIAVDAARDWPRLVVVTSALAGVTDLLLKSARAAARGDLSAGRAASQELSRRHLEIAAALVSDPSRRTQLIDEINALLSDFSSLTQAMAVLGEATPRALDAVASLGERLSVRLLAAAVTELGLPAQAVEATRLVVTDSAFTNALPDMNATALCIRSELEPLLAQKTVPVVTGFIGATPDGLVTTLGRGGSDFTASILGVALCADEVWIWTDVDGVMTADPRLVKSARTW